MHHWFGELMLVYITYDMAAIGYLTHQAAASHVYLDEIEIQSSEWTGQGDDASHQWMILDGEADHASQAVAYQHAGLSDAVPGTLYDVSQSFGTVIIVEMLPAGLDLAADVVEADAAAPCAMHGHHVCRSSIAACHRVFTDLSRLT